MAPPPKKRPKFLYPEEAMAKAIEAVKNGESASEVSRRFEVPRSTLIYKSTGKSPEARKMGPAPALGASAEQMLVNWVMGLAQRGFPIYKWDLITSVQQICKELRLPNLFTNDRPGKKWLYLFLKRHPEIARRTVEKLSKVRAVVTERGIREWFQEVDSYLTERKLKSVLEDPTRVFNCDESNFMMCPKGEKVLGIRGQKNVYEVHQGNDKDNITVLFNVSANGEVAPTMVVYPGKRLPQGARLSMPKNWAIGRSEKGWMNGETFFEYFVNIFYQWLVANNVQFPVIVFLDGHSSHLTYHLSKFCNDHDIVLITLFPNATHVLQPLDVSVFKPLKQGWGQGVHEWRMSNNREKLTKYNFAPILGKIIDSSLKTDTIKNGFKRTGLCPFDPNQVDYSKVEILSSAPKQPKETGISTVSNSGPSLSQNQSKQTDIPTVSNDESSLKFMESFINPATLLEFKVTYSKFTPVWDGHESAHDLYVVWKKAKDFVLQSTRVNNVPSVTEANPSRTHQTPKKVPEVNVDDGHQADYQPSSTEVEEMLQFPTTSNHNTASALQTSRPTPKRIENLSKILSPETDGKGVPTPFKKTLFWPGTPPKKSSVKARRTLKLPAVVSSHEWLAYENLRKEKKEEEQKKKEDRKLAREKKRKENSKKTAKGKACKKTIDDVEEDWICKICLKRYSAELIIGKRRRWVECDTCQGQYHYKCVPKKHLDAFGLEESDEEEEEVNFICHLCAADVDTDYEDLRLTESSENDE